MREIINEVIKNKSRLAVSILTTFFMIFIPFYPQLITDRPLWLQISMIMIVVIINLALGSFPDVVKIAIKHRRLQEKFGTLKSEFDLITKAKDQELTELKDVIVTFLEHSHTYQDKLLRLLRIQGEYLCIAKSSEGLSDVFNALKTKTQLPFSKVLTNWPGAIKPFENMNLFLLPIAQLKGFKEDSIKEWITTNIIPLVEHEREIFLASLPHKLSKLADDFSYKYLAFVIHSNSIEYDTNNRKFTKTLINTLIETQSQRNVAHMTQALTEIIRTKDFFNIVDWSAFIHLNADQKRLFDEHKATLVDLLEQNNLRTLVDISRSDRSTLKSIYLNAFSPEMSERRAINLTEKTLDGITRVLTILRKHGVNV